MYKLARTKADATDDDSPNDTEPPTDEIFTVKAGRGYRCFLKFDAGETADATVWHFSSAASRWVGMEPLEGIGPDSAFGDAGPGAGVAYGKVWVQLTNISGGDPIDVFLEDA